MIHSVIIADDGWINLLDSPWWLSAVLQQIILLHACHQYACLHQQHLYGWAVEDCPRLLNQCASIRGQLSPLLNSMSQITKTLNSTLMVVFV